MLRYVRGFCFKRERNNSIYIVEADVECMAKNLKIGSYLIHIDKETRSNSEIVYASRVEHLAEMTNFDFELLFKDVNVTVINYVCVNTKEEYKTYIKERKLENLTEEQIKKTVAKSIITKTKRDLKLVT
jgi:nicotinamide mononucleotide adenylyltransferase